MTKRDDDRKLACVDLFCGCGGMSLGFEKAGYDVRAGFELWEAAMRVYEAGCWSLRGSDRGKGVATRSHF